MRITGWHIYIGCIFILLHSFGISQNGTDSLLNSIKSAKHDSVRVNGYNSLFLQFEFEDEQKAQEYLDKAFALAQKINYKKGLALTHIHLGYFAEDQGNFAEALNQYTKALQLFEAINYKVGIADSYNSIGMVHNSMSDYSSAIKNYSFALKTFESIGSIKGIASANNNIGLVYSNQGNNPEALKHYFASLKIFQKTGDRKSEAKSFNNIGNIYRSQNNYTEAFKNHFTALKIRHEIGDEVGLAVSYNNIGNVYFLQGNYEEALKNYDTCLNMREGFNDKLGIADVCVNIGIVYMKQANYQEALSKYLKALNIYVELNDELGIASSYGNIANVHIKQKKYNEAEKDLLKAKELSIKIGYRDYLKDVYAAFTLLDSSRNNYKGAYQNHILFISYRDSIDNELTRKKTIENQMTYDFEKKEAVAKAEHQKEIENQKTLAEEKNRKQNLIIAFVAIGLLLVLVFAGFIFRSLRVTRKQKHIIEQQKHLVEEHQKEIIDSITYAKRLQQAILPSAEEIKKHLANHFILYKPKDIVAGDFYWMHVVDDLIFIAAADSTGHGVPGAMVSVVCSNALNRAVDEFRLRDTGKILDKTRELVLETFAKSGEEIKDGMDVSLLCIDRLKQQIYWSGANNPLWYLCASAPTELVEVKANKQPIGKTDNPVQFKTHYLQLNQGDVFYLMTDGYADQFGGPKGKKYKYKALEEKLIAIHHLSLHQQHEELVNSFNIWKGNLEQVDDVTIIGIKI